jgi:hypothetical protein
LSCEKKVVASGSYEDIAVDDGGNVWVVGDDILFYDGFAWSKKISGVEISDDVIFSSVYIDDNDFWLAGVNTFGDDTGSAFSCDYNDVLPGTCEFKVHKLEYLDGNYPKPFFPKDFVVDGIRVIAVGEKGIITVTNSDMIDFREGSYHAIVDDLDGKYFAVGDRFVSFNVINGRIINFEEQILDYKLFDIFGVDASIAVGEKGKVFLSLYPGSGEFDAPTVKDLYTGWWDKDDHFYVAGQDGVLFKQDLNGVWTKLDSQTTMNIKAGYTTDDGKIILAGDEGIIQLDCQNACVGPQEICNDGIDNDNNNQVDCLDSTCSDFPTCQPDEICENEIDDDKDGKTDCDDSDCLTYCKGLKWATEDDDFDGVLNPFDDCPSSLQGVQVDKDGCSSIVQPEKCIDNDGDGYDTCYLGKGDGKSKDCDDKDDSITACTLGYVCDDSECVSQLCGTDATCQESEYFEGDSLDVTACGVDYNIKVNGITNTCDVDFSWDESGYPVNLPLGSKTLEDVEINVLKIGTGSCQLTTKAIDCEQCVDDTVLIQEINKWLSSKNPNADADLIKSINSWLAGCPT